MLGSKESSPDRKSRVQDENDVNGSNVDPDYIENILMEQSSYYNDEKDAKIEVHRVKTTRDITRVETKITSLPKPPPSFIIPRSRSTSPSPQTASKSKQNKPVLKHMPLEAPHGQRLSAPFSGVSSRSSSADSSPVGTYSTSFIPASVHTGSSLPGTTVPQSGSLDRLSPHTARRKFFEEQPTTSSSFLSWPERRKRELNQNRNSRSLTGSTEVFSQDSVENVNGKSKLRNSISMDEGVGIVEPIPSLTDTGSRSRSAESAHRKSHSSLRDMFAAMKKKFKPKVKRSQSAREPDRSQKLQVVKEADRPGTSVAHRPEVDDSHVTQDQLTPIDIPDDKKSGEQDEKKHEKERKVNLVFGLLITGYFVEKYFSVLYFFRNHSI